MTAATKLAPKAIRQPGGDSLVEALADALLVIDGGDVIRRVNPAAENFFEAGEDQLMGLTLGDLVRTESPLLDLAAKARGGAAAVTEYEIALPSPSLRSRMVDARLSAVAGFEGWLLITLRERSIAHKLDRQLTHLGAGRSVAGLGAALAHEVKNPLAGIRGAAQLLEGDMAESGRDLTRLITEECDRICRLVDRMEVFSSDFPADREPVNIHAALDQAKRSAEGGFAAGVRFIERYDPSLPPVLGDHDALVAMFLNLIKNAAEALGEKNGRDGGEITLTTAYQTGPRQSAPGGESHVRLPLLVAVADNGAGIPEAIREHLFEPFITAKTDGTGLGLALVAKTVGDHGGIIEFTSEPGATVFNVLLPLHRDPS